MLDRTVSLKIARSFLYCLAAADERRTPYPHWLLADVLPDEALRGIDELPFGPPDAARFEGRREVNNSARVFFGAKVQAAHPVAADLAAAFKRSEVVAAIEQRCGTDLSEGQLRIEYCQDVDGFWLEPHTDISVKLFTMLIYLSAEDELADAGTDIYDGDLKHVGRSPFGRNLGLIFIPAADTWHGFDKRPIRGVRRSLIVNYVSPAWRAVEELA